MLILFLFTKTIFGFEQPSANYGQVIQADVNRGGWYGLEIKSDTAVIFAEPFTCGFGHERSGTWILNEVNNTITLTFSTSTGYMNSPGTRNIHEVEIYKINKLTANELILSRLEDGIEKTIPFIKTTP